MGGWTSAELNEAFERYQVAVTRSVETGDWEHFVQCFSPDATYVEHAYGRFAAAADSSNRREAMVGSSCVTARVGKAPMRDETSFAFVP